MAKLFTITEGLENLGAIKTGGQGSVYKGRREGGVLTAIKLLPTPIHSENQDDKNFVSFQNEVKKLLRVNEKPNPNVVKILGSGMTESGNFPFIEMEFIEGPDLEELLLPPHDPIFTISEAIKVARHISGALAHCHTCNISHGDIKSNNIKYNIHSGNYMLLDFGLAVMSDEQRRTSLRHAGAIEFMAPEQNDGKTFLQTDVYGFGIIIYELLAGTVPFPLRDKGETARNAVMIAHMESVPPDLMELRLKNMPANWSEEKQEEELRVPSWLTEMVYKCIQKNPEDRFGNGIELNEYILKYDIPGKPPTGEDRTAHLMHENLRLKIERDKLQQQLQQLHKENEPAVNSDLENKKSTEVSPKPVHGKLQPLKLSRKKIWFFAFIILISIAALYGILKIRDANKKTERLIGEYKVVVPKAYFYNEPKKSTRRNIFLIPSAHAIKVYNRKGDFLYTEIESANGDVLEGWLYRKDVLSVSEWNKKYSKTISPEVTAQVSAQLKNAKLFLEAGKMAEALIIYSSLSKQGVPEAMFQYGRLALQNRNKNISCTEAFSLLKGASDKGYVPAKRTLGFIYAYANDAATLKQASYYDRCSFTKNLSAGSTLLMEAMLQGDTIAANLLSDLNKTYSR